MSKTKNDFNEKKEEATIQMNKSFNNYSIENTRSLNNAGGQLNDKLTDLEKETVEFQNNLYTDQDEDNILELNFNNNN